MPPPLLAQARVMLGDTGRSLVVGYGRNPPKRTQDRAAACPNPPEVRAAAAQSKRWEWRG